MAAVTGADLRRILYFLDTAVAPGSAEPFPRPTLLALAELIPADLVEYYEQRRSDRIAGATPAQLARSWIASSTSRDVDQPIAIAEAVARFRHQNPIESTLSGFGPSDGAVRLSRVITRIELRRLDFHEAILRPLGIRDNLKIWLTSSPRSVACVSLVRSDGDFSDRDAAVLRVLQSHLAVLRANVLARQAMMPPDNVSLTPREAEVLAWVARGKSSEETACLLFISPATVRKHLEHIYEKLGVHSRTEAMARVRRSGTAH